MVDDGTPSLGGPRSRGSREAGALEPPLTPSEELFVVSAAGAFMVPSGCFFDRDLRDFFLDCLPSSAVVALSSLAFSGAALDLVYLVSETLIDDMPDQSR